MTPRSPLFFCIAVTFWIGLTAGKAIAGPEITLREFAGGQVKKGVRTIAMGGDGATTGNYALVYKDAGSAIFDAGVVRFSDTGNWFTFTAVGFTTPKFWNDAAFYVIALSQRGSNVRVWSRTSRSATKPSSRGNLADSSMFIKLAKPLSKSLSLGFMGAFEQSDALLLPDNGTAPIRFSTAYLPSGGIGLHWHPNPRWQVGARVILNHDWETRAQGAEHRSGLIQAYEYRLGMACSPWSGTLIDLGGDALQRSNAIDKTKTLDLHPTVGIEQALVRERVWARVGLDETTWTSGLGAVFGRLKIDLAYLYDLGAARTADVFGRTNRSLIATLGFDYLGR